MIELLGKIFCSVWNIHHKYFMLGNLQIAGALVSLAIGIFVLHFPTPFWNRALILCIDGYIAFLVICAAVASTPETENGLKEASSPLPTRPVALLILPLFVVALIAAFGAEHKLLFQHNPSEYVLAISEHQPGLAYAGDAFYFSAVTMLTLGSNEVIPVGGCAKLWVLLELLSGSLMLIGAIPLLVGRLTTWSHD